VEHQTIAVYLYSVCVCVYVCVVVCIERRGAKANERTVGKKNRCRIGQQRVVRVKRYIVKDTVEENILRLQEQKQAYTPPFFLPCGH